MILYVDESACYLLPLLAHTWGPKGSPPVVRQQAGRAHLSLIAAVAPNGRVYVGGQDAAFSGEDIEWFLEKLCHRYRKRNLLLIWDGASVHRSEAVKALLRARPGRIYLERLPAYSPELNPVELLWSHLKRSLKNRVFTHLEELEKAILEQVEGLHKDAKMVKTFFRKREVGFVSD